MLLSSIAYGSFNGSAVGDKSVGQVALETYFPEGETALVYDGAEQAMAVQAIMRAVAKRSFLVGSYPFQYQHNAQAPPIAGLQRPRQARRGHTRGVVPPCAQRRLTPPTKAQFDPATTTSTSAP